MGYLIQPVHSLQNGKDGANSSIPAPSKSDNGKVLAAKNGKWVPTKLSSPKLAKVATSGSYQDLKNVPDLSNFISESEVYNMISEAVGDITSFDTQVVDELPAHGIKGTIYFLTKSDSTESDNTAKEYIWVNDSWELIGDTGIDLSPYVTWNNIGAAAESNDYNDLDNLPNIPIVPMGLSEFDNDAGFITQDDIPTNVSEFENDADYIPREQYNKLLKAVDNLIAEQGKGARGADGEFYESAMDGIDAAEPFVPVEVALTKDEDDGDAFLLMNAEGDENKDITFDLNGHEYLATKAGGSAGTQTQAVHLEKGNTVVIKGGTLSAALENPSIKMLIQNYANLTLEDMVIDCSENSNITYCVSNNFGHCVIKNCLITAAPGRVAVDCWFGLNNQGLYDDGLRVDIIDSVINGDIEYGVQRQALSRPGNEEWWEKAVLSIENSIINGQIKNSGAGSDDQHCIYIDNNRYEGNLPILFDGGLEGD